MLQILSYRKQHENIDKYFINGKKKTLKDID